MRSGTKRRRMKGTKREHTMARRAGQRQRRLNEGKEKIRRLSAGIPRFPRTATL